jgi:ribokinase
MIEPGIQSRVVVVGSANVDLVMDLPELPAAGQTVLGGALTRHEGGKGANQAVAAARAGARVHFVGAVGADDGHKSVAALQADGVDVAALRRVDAPTGHAFVLVSDSGENQIAVASGANDLVTADQVTAALTRLRLVPADVVVLSFELPAAGLRAAVAEARAAGSRVVVNPGPVRPRFDDLLDGAIATPNAGELAALTGRPGSTAGADEELRAAACSLASQTGAPVVVTLGPHGALLTDRTGALHVPGYGVPVVDTTGAGDTFTGVLAASLAAGMPLRSSVRRAVAASALAVTRHGARAGMPSASQIDELLSRAAG